MSSNKVFREIAQDGLDRRADARRDAALEAQARKLRLIINENHIAKTGKKAAQQSERRKAEVEALKRKQEIRAQRVAEAAYCADWYGFMLRIFAPLFIAAATIGMANTGVLPLALAIPFTIVACLISIETFAARILRERR